MICSAGSCCPFGVTCCRHFWKSDLLAMFGQCKVCAALDCLAGYVWPMQGLCCTLVTMHSHCPGKGILPQVLAPDSRQVMHHKIFYLGLSPNQSDSQFESKTWNDCDCKVFFRYLMYKTIIWKKVFQEYQQHIEYWKNTFKVIIIEPMPSWCRQTLAHNSNKLAKCLKIQWKY